MIRLSVIFGLLFQSLVAICCGNLLSSKADGCCGPSTPTCCCSDENAQPDSGCCSETKVDLCCDASHPASAPSDCKCCLVSPDTPQAPAEPTRRPSSDTEGVAAAPVFFAPILMPAAREPLMLALRHEPPWPSGRALLADQCRWNL